MLHRGNLKRFLNEEALPDIQFLESDSHETSAEPGLEPRQEKGYFVRYPLSLLAISVQDEGNICSPYLDLSQVSSRSAISSIWRRSTPMSRSWRSDRPSSSLIALKR